MKLPILMLIIGIAAILLYLYYYAVSSPYLIDAKEAKHLINTNQIDIVLDVRTDLERSTLGAYPNSVHIQSADLPEQMPRRFPNKKLRILAYCNSGQRARKASEILHRLGYRNAVYIATTYRSLL
jgi:rhodanese-related sulfurtransferase